MKKIKYEDIWEYINGNKSNKSDEAILFLDHLNNLSLKTLNKSFDSIKIDKEKDKEIVFIEGILKIPSKSSELFDFFIHGFNIENPEKYFKAFKMHKESFGLVILDVINSYYDFVPSLLSKGMEKKKSDKILKELVSKLPHNISDTNQIPQQDNSNQFKNQNSIKEIKIKNSDSRLLSFQKKLISKENFMKSRKAIISIAAVVTVIITASWLIYPEFFQNFGERKISKTDVNQNLNQFVNNHYAMYVAKQSSSTKAFTHAGVNISNWHNKETYKRAASIIGDIHLTIDLISEGASFEENQNSLNELINLLQYMVTPDNGSLSKISSEKFQNIIKLTNKSSLQYQSNLNKIKVQLCDIINNEVKQYSGKQFNEVLNLAGAWYFINGKKYLKKINFDSGNTANLLNNTQGLICGISVKDLYKNYEEYLIQAYQKLDVAARRIDFKQFVAEEFISTYFPTVERNSILLKKDSDRNSFVVNIPYGEDKNTTLNYIITEINSGNNISTSKVIFSGRINFEMNVITRGNK